MQLSQHDNVRTVAVTLVRSVIRCQCGMVTFVAAMPGLATSFHCSRCGYTYAVTVAVMVEKIRDGKAHQ